MIEPPIVVDAKSEVLLFRSAERAAAYLEAIDVRNDEYPTAYDSKGRLLELGTRFEEHPFFFGLIRRKLEVVGVRALDEEPNHAIELAQLLRTHLPSQELNELPTDSTNALLTTAISRIGFTT
jgi:hypothetical protein